MDNLSAHKGGRVKEIVEGAGCDLVYLPPYSSPDFNPIEQAFSKVKGLMRKAEARSTREALIEAMGQALEAVTASDARGFFGHLRATCFRGQNGASRGCSRTTHPGSKEAVGQYQCTTL